MSESDDVKQNSKSRLSSIFNKYDDYLKQQQETKEKEKSEREIFTESFLEIRDGTIKPVFEQMKTQIENRGFKAYIRTKAPSWDAAKNIPEEPSISFELELVAEKENNQDLYYRTRFGGRLPSFVFICDFSKKRVWTHESTPSSGGQRGDFKLNEITKEVVEEELLNWFEKMMKDVTRYPAS